jgi:hypothetical protein
LIRNKFKNDYWLFLVKDTKEMSEKFLGLSGTINCSHGTWNYEILSSKYSLKIRKGVKKFFFSEKNSLDI